MPAELFTGITVFGLYDDQTQNPLFGVNGTVGTPSATDIVVVGGFDSTNTFRALSQTSNGYLNVNASVSPPSDSVATGTLTNPGDVVTVSTEGTSALMVQITLSAAITAGQINFQVSYDGTTFVTAQLFPLPVAGGQEGSPSVSSTTTAGVWTLPVGGIQKFQVVASGTFAGGPAAIVETAGQGQYGVFNYSDNAANFLATVTQGPGGASAWLQNLSEVAGVTLGAAAVVAFGGAVGVGNVPAVNSSIYAGTTALTQTGGSLNTNITGGTVTISGTVAVTQSTSPWIVAGNKTNNTAAPNGTNVGALVAQALATPAAAYTAGNLVLLNTDLAGNLNTDLQYYAGTALGTPTNFGTTPGAVIAQSTNASIFSGTTAITNTGGSLNVNITGTTGGTLSVAGTLTNNNAAPAANNVGTLGYIATATPETYTQGDQVLATTSLGGATRVVPVDEANASSLNYFEIDNANAYVAVTTAFTPVMAWQTNSASFIYLIRMLQFFTSGTVCEFVLLKNPTVVGGAFVAASGHLNYNVTATSYTGGTKVLGGYAGTQPFLMQQMLDAMAAGAPGDTFAIEARSFTGNGSVVSAVRWSEQAAAL